jgi:hypothetical protein
MRAASNRDELVGAVRKRCGIEIEVIRADRGLRHGVLLERFGP